LFARKDAQCHAGKAIMPIRSRLRTDARLDSARKNGVMIATNTGTVTAYSLDALYDRGVFFVEPGDTIYEGQVVGEHCKENDIPVNPVKAKQLSNMRASGKDDAARVRPARIMSLEIAMEYIQEDELVEICPNSIRIRKRFLRKKTAAELRAAVKADAETSCVAPSSL
jgi:GTP-binding protein